MPVATIEREAVLSYYQKYTLELISQRLLKKLRKVADSIAKEIMESYDFKQKITTTVVPDDRIIITSVLTKKKK